MLCCALTKTGNRCKRKGKYLIKDEGFYIYTCRQHSTTLCVDKWRHLTLDQGYISENNPPSLNHIFSIMLYFYTKFEWTRHISSKISDYVWYDFLHLNFNDDIVLSVAQVDKVFIKRFIQKNFNYKLRGINECPICYDTCDSSLETCCGHVFCFKCIVQVLNYQITCPMCRGIILDVSELNDV